MFARDDHPGRVVIFLQVLIPGSFKSLKMEVLILRELRMRFAQVLKLGDLAIFRLAGRELTVERLPGRMRRAGLVRRE
jgi:hypothetical protein